MILEYFLFNIIKSSSILNIILFHKHLEIKLVIQHSIHFSRKHSFIVWTQISFLKNESFYLLFNITNELTSKTVALNFHESLGYFESNSIKTAQFDMLVRNKCREL